MKTVHHVKRRHLLQAVLNQRLSWQPHKILSTLLHGHSPPRLPATSGWLTGDGGGASMLRHNTFTPPADPRTMAGFDQKKMESTIDQMVASSLVHGQQTSAVLRLLFGLVPGLIGR